MADAINPDEVQADSTQGFKLGPKHSIQQYQNIDAEDESLVRWKQSLGIGTGVDISNPNDHRTVIIKELAFIPDNREPTVFDLTQPQSLESLKSKPFTIKEGAIFRLKVTFQVQHSILSGLKYVQVVKRLGMSNKVQQMIGSYGPNTEDRREYSMTFDPETAPSGLLARGEYKAVSKFVDDDNNVHLMFEWSFEIKKDW